MSDSLNICLPCGICCNGTLIGHVQIESEELPALKEIMEIEDENETGFFLQPCKSFCNRCTIYSKRPKQCASFECGLLKSVEQKELSFDSALEIINTVKQKKVALENKIETLQIELKSESFHFKMAELKILLNKKKSASSFTQKHIELMSDLEHLDNLLLQKFGVTLY